MFNTPKNIWSTADTNESPRTDRQNTDQSKRTNNDAWFDTTGNFGEEPPSLSRFNSFKAANTEQQNVAKTSRIGSITNFFLHPIRSIMHIYDSPAFDAAHQSTNPAHRVEIEEMLSRRPPVNQFFKSQIDALNVMIADADSESEEGIHFVINKIYCERMLAIEATSNGEECATLKLIQYHEWVEALNIINNKNTKRLEKLEIDSKAEEKCLLNQATQEQQGETAYKRDIFQLMHLIYKGYMDDKWDPRRVSFETLSPSQLAALGQCCATSAEADE